MKKPDESPTMLTLLGRARWKTVFPALVVIVLSWLPACTRTEADNRDPRKIENAESSPIVKLRSADEFHALLNSNRVVMIDFYADWCPPCKMLKPIIAEIAGDYNEKVKVVAVDVDQFGKIAGSFNVVSIPTVIVFNTGKAEDVFVGVQPKSVYTNALDRFL